MSGSLQSEQCVKNGKEIIATLLTNTVNIRTMNPIAGKQLWLSCGLPKMLYGAEPSSNFTVTNINDIERVNEIAAKRIMGLSKTTMSEAALSNLGLWPIELHITKKKMFCLVF